MRVEIRERINNPTYMAALNVIRPILEQAENEKLPLALITRCLNKRGLDVTYAHMRIAAGHSQQSAPCPNLSIPLIEAVANCLPDVVAEMRNDLMTTHDTIREVELRMKNPAYMAAFQTIVKGFEGFNRKNGSLRRLNVELIRNGIDIHAHALRRLSVETIETRDRCACLPVPVMQALARHMSDYIINDNSGMNLANELQKPADELTFTSVLKGPFADAARLGLITQEEMHNIAQEAVQRVLQERMQNTLKL